MITPSSTILLDDIKIRLIDSKDTDKITSYYTKNRFFLQPWEPIRTEVFYTPLGWKQRIEQIEILHRHEMAYYFVIEYVSTGDIIGVVNFSNLVKSPFYACHVGYSLDEDFQGKSIMKRALQAAIGWMFEEKQFHRIMAAYMTHNSRSANVLKSAGFVKEGLAKDYLLIDGEWKDHVLTSLINPNWTEPK